MRLIGIRTAPGAPSSSACDGTDRRISETYDAGECVLQGTPGPLHNGSDEPDVLSTVVPHQHPGYDPQQRQRRVERSSA